jgi:hypothetical protein
MYEDQPLNEDEEKPAAEPPPEPETVEEPARDAFAQLAPSQQAYDLELPADLPASAFPNDAQARVEEFSQVAADSGMPVSTAQVLLDAFVESSLDTRYDRPLLGPGAIEAADGFMRAYWRESYDTNLAHVRAAVKKLGKRFASWLEETGYGNHPAALDALAAYGSGALTLSKDEARTRLDTLMKSKEFTAPKSAIAAKTQAATVRRLYKLANATDAADGPARDPFAAMKARNAAPAAPASPAPATETWESARKELAEMVNDKSGALLNVHDPGHKDAVARMHKLAAILKP